MAVPFVPRQLARTLAALLSDDEHRLRLLEEGCEVLARRAPGLFAVIAGRLQGAEPIEVAIVVFWFLDKADQIESAAGVEVCACRHLRRHHFSIGDDEPCEIEGCGCRSFSLAGEGREPTPEAPPPHVETDHPAACACQSCCAHRTRQAAGRVL